MIVLFGSALFAASVALPQPINPDSWITQDDYPSGARARVEEGVVAVDMTIDQRGKISKCEISKGSGFPELDAYSCAKLLRVAKFRPARNEKNEPSWGIYHARFNWQLVNFGSAPAEAPDVTLVVKSLPSWYKKPVDLAVQVSPAGQTVRCAASHAMTAVKFPETAVASLCAGVMNAGRVLTLNVRDSVAVEHIRSVKVALALN